MSPKRSIIPVFVPHLGCPNDCVFCNQRRISGTLTPATKETVIQAVEDAERLNLTSNELELAFYGGSFTAIPGEEQEELLSAAYEFIKKGRLNSIRLSTRPDCIDTETVERLKHFGVSTVELGVQSMCPDVLSASNRGHTAEDAVKAAELIKNTGFTLILQMMTGLPLDTREKSVFTARELSKLKPDGVRIYPTVIIKDTALFDMWCDGMYQEHTVEEAADWCSEIMDVFESENIPVIRLGLNPTDELSGGAAAGGAYHPAFGELVAGKRYLKKADKLLDGKDCVQITFGVARGEISKAVGQKRCNILLLTEKYGLKKVLVKETDIKKGEIVILSLSNDYRK
ncbi:MAG: radical SAM protein [Ruminococcaceae bacterium]|nr:radical SAM protein [Oscillospiraceae bacterium]